MSNQSDHELLAAWQRNDQEAYAILVARYHGIVRAACARQMTATVEVDDCVQAVFLVMARRPAAAARAPALAAWLLKVAWYVCQRSNRAGWRRRQAESSAARAQTQPQRTGSEALEYLDDCLLKLPEKQRTAVSLHYLAGKTPEEIAVTLGTSRENAYKLVTRGIASLKSLLARRGMAVSATMIASLMASEASAATTSATAAMTSAMTATASVKVNALAAGAISAMTTAILAPIAAAAGIVMATGLAAWSLVLVPAPPAAHVPIIQDVEMTVYTDQNSPSTTRLDDLDLCRSVTQHGITWNFQEPTRVGRFVTGDWYVVGAATITAISPMPLFGDAVMNLVDMPGVVQEEKQYPHQQARHGSMVNPLPDKNLCGFDSRMINSRYDPKLFAQLPIHLVPGDSLVSTISRSTEACSRISEGVVQPTLVAAVLTCLSTPVPPDAFRPSYCMTATSRMHFARDLHRELLPRLPRTSPRFPTDLKATAASFSKAWMDIVKYGFATPVENNPRNGQFMASIYGDGGLLLCLDYPASSKEQVLIGMVQVGIDLYGLARGGASWKAVGGQTSGRKFPIIFAGLMLGDRDMQQLDASLPGVRFAEDDQTAFGPVSYRGQLFERSWSGSRAIFMGHSADLSASLEEQERSWLDGCGLVDVYPPAEWPRFGVGSKDPGFEAYRTYVTSGYWVSQTLAMRILHLEPQWNHDAFFAYMDRWMTEDDTAQHAEIRKHNIVYTTTARYGEFGRMGHVHGPAWVRDMWQSCRDQLPPREDGMRVPPSTATWR